MVDKKNIFVIHTQSLPEHRDIHDALCRILSPYSSLQVVDYGDWQWSDPEERFLPSKLRWMKADPTIPRSIFRKMEKVEPERVRTEDLERFFMNCDATILLDATEPTEGMYYEFETLRPMIRESQEIGCLALVAFGKPSLSARDFGLAYTDVFSFEEHKEVNDALSLFAARACLAGSIRKVGNDETIDDVVLDLLRLSNSYISSGVDHKSPVAPQITTTAKSILRYLIARNTSHKHEDMPNSSDKVVQQSLSFLEYCIGENLLDEDGLSLFMQFCENQSVESDYLLEEVMYGPVFVNREGERVVYPHLTAHAARILGRKEGKTAASKLLNELTGQDYVPRRKTKLLALGHAGRFSDEDADLCLNFLRKTYNTSGTADAVRTICIEAAQETGGDRARDLLRDIIRHEGLHSSSTLPALLGLITAAGISQNVKNRFLLGKNLVTKLLRFWGIFLQFLPIKMV